MLERREIAGLGLNLALADRARFLSFMSAEKGIADLART